MNQQQFFEEVIQQLEKFGIPYMISGSIGAMIYGEPRLTNDMDIVIELNELLVEPLLNHFLSEAFYVPPTDVVTEEIGRRGQFNILHIDSGSKVGLIIRKDTEFAREEFSRRRLTPFSEKVEAQSATPEDIIISKLNYYKIGGSEKHIQDIRSMVAVSGEELDFNYLRDWVDRLDLKSEWRAIESGH